jgi:hydroxysqualene synthase
VPVNHYENFPVASWLCPSSLRPAVVAIYNFARTADDIADEGQACTQARLSDLSAYRSELLSVAGGAPASPRWAAVFDPLQAVLTRHALPLQLLTDLLSAFTQDAAGQRYADRAELLDYCRRSANPVGRLMLHLYGIDEPTALRRSDAICTALQLANFWQDLGVDLRRDRHYIPLSDCLRHGLSATLQWPAIDSVRTRALVTELAQWARSLMLQGAALVHQVPGRAGWELRLVVQGGLRILEKVDRLGGATISTRPVVGATDAPVLLWRALLMRERPAQAAEELP